MIGIGAEEATDKQGRCRTTRFGSERLTHLKKIFSLMPSSYMELKFSLTSAGVRLRHMPGTSQDLRRRLQELAFGQSGYFTAAQALGIGYSHQAQKYHVDHGNWVRVARGLFRLPGWPSHSDDTYVRWVLWSGGRGVVSHDSALAVHNLSDANPSHVHLTVPAGFRAVDDAVVTHLASLEDEDIEVRGPWCVTTVERTLLDVADSDVSQEIVDSAVADALERDLTTRRRLLRRTGDTSDRGALRLEHALAVWAGA